MIHQHHVQAYYDSIRRMKEQSAEGHREDQQRHALGATTVGAELTPSAAGDSDSAGLDPTRPKVVTNGGPHAQDDGSSMVAYASPSHVRSPVRRLRGGASPLRSCASFTSVSSGFAPSPRPPTPNVVLRNRRPTNANRLKAILVKQPGTRTEQGW